MYVLTYGTTLDRDASITSVSNKAILWNGNIEMGEGSTSNIGVGISKGEKKGEIVEGNKIKWTLTLNPNHIQIPAEWITNFSDQLNGGNANVTDVSLKVTDAAGSTVTGSYNSIKTITDLNSLVSWVTTNMKANSTDKFEFTYCTAIVNFDTAKNVANFGGNIESKDVNLSFTNGIQKYFDDNIGVREVVQTVDGQQVVYYKLPWKVTINTPTRFDLPAAMTITDSVMEGDHYLLTTDESDLAGQLAEFGDNVNITYTETTPGSNKASGVTITIPQLKKQTTITKSFYIYTYVNAEDYVGLMKNRAQSKIGNDNNTLVTAEDDITLDTNLSIEKWFSGDKEERYDEEAKKYKEYALNQGHLQWTISTSVPNGTGSYPIQITDTLPIGVEMTNVRILVGDEKKIEFRAQAGSVNGVETVQKAFVVQASTSGQELIVLFRNGHSLAAGTSITIVIDAKLPDDYFTGKNSEVELLNTVRMDVNHGRASDEWSTWVEKIGVPEITKSAVPATDVYNTVNYTVVINPGGEKLLSGNGKLTVKDTMKIDLNGTKFDSNPHTTETDEQAKQMLIFVPETMKLVKVQIEDGKKIETDLPFSDYSFDAPVVTCVNDVIEAVMKLEVPDGVELKLTYQYRLAGKVKNPNGNNALMYNLVELIGDEFENSSSSSETFEYKYSAGGSVTTSGVSFIKHTKGQDAELIEGAKFWLFEGNDAVYDKDTGYRTHISEATTDKYGRLKFTDVEWKENTVYQIVEREVPGVWRLDTTPFKFSIGIAEGSAHVYSVGDVGDLYNEAITTSLSGTKEWVGDGEYKDYRPASPASIELTLYADGVATTQKQFITPNSTEDDTWTWEFKNLRKYKLVVDDQGKKQAVEIQYTVVETPIPNYTVSYDGTKVTNTLETVNISGCKVWQDAEDQDGIRPTSITIYIKDGKQTVQTIQLTASGEDGEWLTTDLNFTSKNLPKYRADGTTLIEYTVEESSDATVKGQYTVNIEKNVTNGLVYVTNAHKPEEIDIEGKKTWLDSGNQDGVRPKSIKVQLLADGKQVAEQIVTADQDGNWKWTFENKPKYDHGVEIKYTVSETPVTWYTTTYSDDGLNIINSYTPDETGRTVRKVWLDNDDQDGIRPKSIQVQLLTDGKAYGAPVELNEQNNWTYTWTRLPVNKPVAQKIQYTVQEIGSVAGYTTSYSEDTFTITNTHVVEKTSVSGGKTWNDANDQDGVRPDSITINLLADGQKIASKTVTEADGWKWSFTNLPKYRDHGTAIVYTITEEAIEGYEADVNGYDVVNTHVPGTVDISGSKTWNDANDQDGVRPEDITINLFADGQKIASKTVTEADGWKWSFANLPEFRDHGIAIVYTITEDAVAGYETDVNGYDVVNTHVPATIEISGSKTWVDGNDVDGIRPRSITVNLLANGVRVESKTVTRADGWSWTFVNLPKYAGGVEIVYTITETPVRGYRTEVNGYDITNRHTPEPTPTITPEPEPTPTPTPTPTIPEEVKRATRKPVDGAIISTITILDDAVPLFGGRGTGDTMPYAVGGLSLAAVLLLVSAYIAKKRSGKHNG